MNDKIYLDEFIDELNLSEQIEICDDDMIENEKEIRIGYINNAAEKDDSVGYYYDGSKELKDFKTKLINIFQRPISHKDDVDIGYSEWDYWIIRSGYLIIPK